MFLKKRVGNGGHSDASVSRLMATTATSLEDGTRLLDHFSSKRGRETLPKENKMPVMESDSQNVLSPYLRTVAELTLSLASTHQSIIHKLKRGTSNFF